MNKKFLSAILFGALMVTSTGTFVSCKDYDDDIENLQGQINNLATKSDVEAKLSQLQTAIDAAKAEATAAVAAAKAADNSEEIAALEAEIAALEKCECDVDAMLAKVKESVDADLATYKAELDELIKQAEGLVGQVADYVTSVELVYSYYKQNQDYVTSVPYLYGSYGKEGDWTTSFSYPMNSSNFVFTPVMKDGETGKSITLDEKIQSSDWIKELSDKYGTDGVLYWNVRYGYEEGYDGQLLTYKTVFEKDNVFGKGLTNEMSFAAPNQVQRTTSFVVRVSPTNAVLTEDMISLVNSQGVKNELVEVVSVEPYTGLLTRAGNNNGLWVITTRLKEYVKEDFNATAADADDRSILFSAAINNTISTAAERNVISSYDISINHTNYVGQSGLYFWVNDTHVKDINNRFDDSSISLEKPGNGEINYYELEWKGGAAVAATNLNANGSPKSNSNTYWAGDDRTDCKPYPAVQGQAITIALERYGYYTGYKYTPDVKAMYITLDKKANAIESAPSEWNAWNKYDIKGLDTVVEGTTAQITINGEETINDVIGFRVYAVNWDGTLVDPDGKAFYVRLGDVADAWSAAATTIVPVNETVEGVESDRAAVTLTKLTGANYATWATDKINKTQPVFHTVFVDVDANGNETVLYSTENEDALSGVDFSKVDKVYTIAADGYAWTDYVDDKTYNGVLNIFNATDHKIATLNVSFTKSLPEAVPAGFSVKTAQLVDNVYNCYLVPDAWTAGAAEVGTMDMDDVFNWGAKAEPARYEITFANAAWDGEKLVNVAPNGTEDLVVAKDYTDADGVVKALIDNTTEHATTVVYNYGKISSACYDADKKAFYDYKVKATEFSTIFDCIYNSTYAWRWATHEDLRHTKNADGEWSGSLMNTKLTYGRDVEGIDVTGLIFGESSKDSQYNKTLNPSYENSLAIVEAHLVSNGNGVEDEYFKVIYTAGTTKITGFDAVLVSSETNPNAAVASTLVITVQDMYGHVFDIKLPMTVEKR